MNFDEGLSLLYTTELLNGFEKTIESIRYEYRHFLLIRVYDENIFLFSLDMEGVTSLVILLKQWLVVSTRQTN